LPCNRKNFSLEQLPVKEKLCAGVALPAYAFAHIGDPDDTSTWKLPIHFPNDIAKTRNHIKAALHRFAEVKAIPDRDLSDVWRTIVGAAKAHGIPVPAAKPERVQPPVAEPTAEPSALPREEKLRKEALAWAALKEDQFLKAFGLET
jgi:hypothetical protein